MRPTAPVSPTHPMHPTQPLQFTQPMHPMQPAQPTFARPPRIPADPTTPMLSATAALPTTPDEPLTPTLPITPEAPTTPAEPTTPAAPTTPAEPTIPAAPTTPAEPATPDASATARASDIEASSTVIAAPYIVQVWAASVGARRGLPIVVVGMLLCFAGCGSEPAPVTEQPPPPSADERRVVREFDALLRGTAIDVRFPVAECATLPRRTRAELRDSSKRIAAARARLARLRIPTGYDRVRTRLDEGLRLIAEANQLLLVWSERSDDPDAGECGQSNDNLRDSAYDEFHDLAKPHLQAFVAKHNPVAAQLRATTWELGAAGLIPR